MKKKVVSIVLSTVIAGTLLDGCGSTAATTTDQATSTMAATTEAAAAASSEAPAATTMWPSLEFEKRMATLLRTKLQDEHDGS